MRPNAAFFNELGEEGILNVYGREHYRKLTEMTKLYPVVITSENFHRYAGDLAETEVIFSTWGMPAIEEEQLQHMKKLKALFYAAGSVRKFAMPFLDSGVIVVSAWVANAVPVAEFSLAQILLSCKGYFRNTGYCRDSETMLSRKVPSGPGIYGSKVAVIGAGTIGRKLIEHLKNFDLKILVVDPGLEAGAARNMGIHKISLQEAFSQALVVSNHLPDTPELAGILDGRLFRSMPRGATFINTGRGRQVNEKEMIEVFTERPDLTALLDVTWPEPPEAGSPLYKMRNVHLSSHIAGSLNNETARLADYAIDEFMRWMEGKPLKYSVTPEMVESMT